MKRRRISAMASLTVMAIMSGRAWADDPATLDPNRQQAIDAAVRDWAPERDFNGVIMAGQSGAPVFSHVQRLAEFDGTRSLDPDTRFQTGSVDKFFTAIAVFALVEEGRLDLDAPVSAYLDDYRPDTGARLTLRHLLTNQSGLPNDILKAFRQAANGEKEAVDALDVTSAVADYASGDLKFEPGAEFDYVLSNWLLVHLILERVTGLSYAEIRERYVFEPAGMHSSGAFVHDLRETIPATDNVAIGFEPGNPAGRGDYWSPRFFVGSYTTARDLLALDQALVEGRLMSKQILDLFQMHQAPENA